MAVEQQELRGMLTPLGALDTLFHWAKRNRKLMHTAPWDDVVRVLQRELPDREEYR